MPGSGAVRSASVAPPSPAEADVCRSILPHTYDARSGLPRHAARPIPQDARCPVCGMFPARTPRWAAQLIFDDGAAYFFDSPVSLLLYLQDVGRYSRGRLHTEVRASYVQDFETGTWLPLDSAWFVHGSDALGPMRAGNLPPFRTRSDAEAFARRHGGQILSAAPLRRALPDALRRQAPHRHGARPPGR
ncbi:hypothetical protein DEH84_05845 [Aquabacterium olei]|uniref:Nitrous oxide reductase accessory protein NosL n=1 Tax=Aquabacterium olei TaxID=1296669 RepID=A0A2U8FPR9_9BURK|nr:hypothetical protein DEH84_05845 [Aquabacterium olei]